MLTSHLVEAIAPPPEPIILADIRHEPVPPDTPLPVPHFEPVMPHVVMPSVPPPVVETPPAGNAITIAPTPPQPPAQPGPVTPPSPAAPPDYLARLLARLAAARDYPRAAQEARIQGVVLMRFTIDRQGRVLSSAIQKSSGVPLLDRGAENTVRRAVLPPMPPDFPGDGLTLTLPIDFHIRR